MSIDIGFFEPFRNNITEINSDGFVIVKIPYGLKLDPIVINQYFTDAQIHWSHRPVVTHFSGYVKSHEILQVLNGMMFKFEFEIPSNFCGL